MEAAVGSNTDRSKNDMLQIAICESNQKHLAAIKQGIITCLFSECEFVIDTYSCANDFTENSEKMRRYDLVFLNPHLSDATGMVTAAKFRNVNIEAQLVFITDDDSYVLNAYKYNAFDYLIKPIPVSTLDDTLQRFFYYKFSEDNCFVLKSGTGVEKIKLNNIKYFSSSGRIVTVHLKKSDRDFYAKLDDVEQSIEDSKFLRIHKSFLVNSAFVQKIDNTNLYMDDGLVLPVSRDRCKEVKEKLLNI
ncbi:MAG: response regulator transcription factor [Clostridia bacterium]|nr:response regulator transcription factor [Clostridia bacterium]